MDAFTPKERAINFSKDEKTRFQSLIEKYKDILFNKKTDNLSNLKKQKIWASIHAEFNAGGDQPRSMRQLKAKFDNMKRNARKDASKQRQLRLRTGGGPPPSPVQLDTEWFRTVMPISMDGLPSLVDDDFVETPPTAVIVIPNESEEVNQGNTVNGGDEMIQDNVVIIGDGVINTKDDEDKENVNTNQKDIYTDSPFDDDVFDSKSPASLLRTPASKPLRIRRRSYASKINIKDLKAGILKRTEEQEDQFFKLKLKYMEEKIKQEKEIFELKKTKLNLKITLLQNKICNGIIK